MLHQDSTAALKGPALAAIGLRWTDSLIRSLLDSLPLAICVHDSGANIIDYNDRAAEMWGGLPGRGEMDGRSIGFRRLFDAQGTPLPYAVSPVARMLDTNQAVVDVELVGERADGGRRTLLVSVLPLIEHGIVHGALTCFLEAPVQNHMPADPAASEPQANLCGHLAHDLANIFQSVRLSVNLIKWRSSVSTLDKALTGIEETAERGLTLTRQLLASAGKMHMTPVPLDLNKMIEQMRMQFLSLCGPLRRLEFKLADDLWPVHADAEHIGQVLLDLVANSCEAMPDGGTVTIATQNSQPGHGEHVTISVSDTGSGIAESVLSHVFEPYFTTKRGSDSKGLGLSAAQGIVRQHHGQIWIDSQVGRGTVVTLALPRGKTQPTLDAKPKAVPLQLVSEPAQKSDVSKRTILVVDDDSTVRAAAVDTLESYGFEVLVAASGAEALAVIGSGRAIDLVLADFQMRPMNGIELIRQARAWRPNLRAILITGWGVLHSQVDETNTTVLRKPLRAEDLVQQVRLALATPASLHS